MHSENCLVYFPNTNEFCSPETLTTKYGGCLYKDGTDRSLLRTLDPVKKSRHRLMRIDVYYRDVC